MAKFPALVVDIVDAVPSPSLACLGEEVRGRGGRVCVHFKPVRMLFGRVHFSVCRKGSICLMVPLAWIPSLIWKMRMTVACKGAEMLKEQPRPLRLSLSLRTSGFGVVDAVPYAYLPLSFKPQHSC